MHVFVFLFLLQDYLILVRDRMENLLNKNLLPGSAPSKVSEHQAVSKARSVEEGEKPSTPTGVEEVQIVTNAPC